MRESRPRARLSCTRCHQRKVRCNLGDQTDGQPCQNCQREDIPCRQYLGVRKSRRQIQPPSRRPTPPPNPIAASSGSSRQIRTDCDDHLPATLSTPGRHASYYGPGSILNFSDEVPREGGSGVNTLQLYDTAAFLALADATTLPSEAYCSALHDAYRKRLAPLVPAMDIDQNNSGLLLRQALCFAGSIMRRPGDHLKGFGPMDFYARIKALLFLGVETDMIAVLKAYCVLACWTPAYVSPRFATQDSPWHWVGVAIRLAQQLGLHKETTHLMLPASTQSRSIWWYLFANDALQSTCYGRPPIIRLGEFDVSLPPDDDSPKFSTSRHFIQLMTTLSTINALASRQLDVGQDELESLVQTLQTWIASLPEDMSLFTTITGERKPHSRWNVELHIFYLIIIILVCLLPGPHRREPAFHSAAVLASSCVSRLYEAMLYRDEIIFLNPIHGWLLVAATIPQLYPLAKKKNSQGEGEEACSVEELDILRKVLVQHIESNQSARLSLTKIDKLIHKQQRGDSLDSEADGGGRGAAAPHRGDDGDDDTEMDGDSRSSRHVYWLQQIRGLFPFPQSISPRMEHLLPPVGGGGEENLSSGQYMGGDAGQQYNTAGDLFPSLQSSLELGEENNFFEWVDLNLDEPGLFNTGLDHDDTVIS